MVKQRSTAQSKSSTEFILIFDFEIKNILFRCVCCSESKLDISLGRNLSKMKAAFLLTVLGLVILSSSTSAAPRAGLFSGIFTRRSNNPAFKCNKINIENGFSAENVTIETRINVFNNEDDDMYTGSDCEALPLDDCDPNVKVYIDTATPIENWPTDVPFTELIGEWDHNDIHIDYNNQRHGVGSKKHAYTACKFVPKFTLATIRVNIEDVDLGGAHNDIINHFNCHWAPNAAVANSLGEAQWATINCCTAYDRKMKSTVMHELKMDVRAYRDNKDASTGGGSCPYGEGRFP